jgi:hypothetical protein
VVQDVVETEERVARKEEVSEEDEDDCGEKENCSHVRVEPAI